MLATLKQVLDKANRGGYAVGAFNVNNLEILQAVVAAAEETKSPVICQTSEGALEYAGMDYLLAILQVAAKKASVPVVIHLDHGKDLKVIEQAIQSGYTSVMIDASALSYAENIKKVKQVVAWAKKKDVSVEAELGALAGIEDKVKVADFDAVLTDPAQVSDFVKQTGVDALAVAVGTLHGAYKAKHGTAKLDFTRLKKIKELAKLPLVLHGASGLPADLVSETKLYCSLLGDCQRLEGAHGVADADIKKAIALGINKINIDSDLRVAFTVAVREAIVEDKKVFDPRKILGPARERIKQVVKQKMELFGSAERG